MSFVRDIRVTPTNIVLNKGPSHPTKNGANLAVGLIPLIRQIKNTTSIIIYPAFVYNPSVQCRLVAKHFGH